MNEKTFLRLKGYIGLSLICLFYWVLDSIWSIISFEYNLKKLMFHEPSSFFDTFLLQVPPYQIVSRLMVITLFLVLGSVILEFSIRQRVAEKKRKELYQTLLTVLNSIDATIYVADMDDYTILFMNQCLIDRLGGDYSGCKCYHILWNSDEVCKHCTNTRLKDDTGNPEGLITWKGRNFSSNTWYLYHDRAIKWVDGRIVRLQIGTDITQLKELQDQRLQAEARLRQAQKMEAIGNLAGGIAHDFNNILFPIIGYSELLIEEYPANHSAQKKVKDILNAGLRGRDLVNQILAFSRQTERQRTPVQAQTVLKEAFKLSRSTIPSNIEMTMDIQKHCGKVLVDPVQLHQIAMNLITNAYHAVESLGGTITMSLKEVIVNEGEFSINAPKAGAYAMITISDTGCGIDPTIVDKIFDPYFTTKPLGKGTGLGLAVVYGIVRENDGEITVDSEIGKGTTFTIYFPLVEQSPESETQGATLQERTGHERILLVDDEAQIVQIEKQMLERLGYTVHGCTRSDEALHIFKTSPHPFDLVITDMNMPNLTGEQLTRELRSIQPDIPIILCTGFSERIDSQKAKAIGVNGFLTKPILKSTLTETVRNILDGTKRDIEKGQ